jgi:ketosteroid isomerase-like protein
MPPERVGLRALATRAFALLNAGELEAFVATMADDVEFTSMVAEAEGTHFRGHEGVRSWWHTVRGAFEDVSWELLEVHEEDGGGVARVLVRGTLGGVPVSQEMWQAVRMREGKAAWWSFFRSKGEALAALRAGR